MKQFDDKMTKMLKLVKTNNVKFRKVRFIIYFDEIHCHFSVIYYSEETFFGAKTSVVSTSGSRQYALTEGIVRKLDWQWFLE